MSTETEPVRSQSQIQIHIQADFRAWSFRPRNNTQVRVTDTISTEITTEQFISSMQMAQGSNNFF